MKCQGTAILIKPDKLPERTKSGVLVVPQNSREMLPEWGTVIDHGSECDTVKIGDHINFPRKSASVITIKGEDHYFIHEHQLFYTREKEEGK
jgi:co-chaperonin GroES (HSP10)